MFWSRTKLAHLLQMGFSTLMWRMRKSLKKVELVNGLECDVLPPLLPRSDPRTNRAPYFSNTIFLTSAFPANSKR